MGALTVDGFGDALEGADVFTLEDIEVILVNVHIEAASLRCLPVERACAENASSLAAHLFLQPVFNL